MFLAWYEQLVDTKNYLLFNKTEYAVDSISGLPPHFHNGVELTVCVKGTDSEVVINGVKHRFDEGTVCFVNSFDIHQYYYKAGTERYVVVISPDCLAAIEGASELSFPSITKDPAVYTALKDFLDVAYGNWDEGADKILRNGFMGMLLGIMKRIMPARNDQNTNKYNETVIGILRYISTNSAQPLTVERVAAEFGYTPNYFSNIFNKFMGVNFREYLNFCRVANYRRLRERDDKISVSEAAERCGFGSVKSLYRACKRVMEIKSRW